RRSTRSWAEGFPRLVQYGDRARLRSAAQERFEMTFNKRSGVAGLTLVFGVLALVLVQGQAKPMCDPDNGGLKLPMGFCALVVADNLGVARHMAVAPNGDLYVALQSSGARRTPLAWRGTWRLRQMAISTSRCRRAAGAVNRRRAVARSHCATPTETGVSRWRNTSAAAR